MARILKRGNMWHISFRHGGRHLSRSLKTSEVRKAEALLARLEENLRDVERGRLVVPPGADLIAFLLSDGKVEQKVVIAKETTLKEFFNRYQKELLPGTKEQNTRSTEDIHIRHLLRLLDGASPVRLLTSQTLQQYVINRSAEKGRFGNPVSHTTVRKEIGTLASIWSKWGVQIGLVAGSPPTKNLLYCKEKTKLPFQTFEQVERQTARAGRSRTEKQQLWGSVFLSVPEIREVLPHVKSFHVPWVYPMFSIAAYTGARRSEILRCQVDDFDFEAMTVKIREKKRDNTREMTFRHVPMSPALRDVMANWIQSRPTLSAVICDGLGHSPSESMTNHYFKDALLGTKWSPLTGWHCFRHSFASNCAMRGVDPRVLDRWLGHQTEEMRNRYLHLFPNHQQDEIARVFAG